ncbi:MAG: hypothetical protein WDO24_26720 [Pseudomonadota bacterium]
MAIRARAGAAAQRRERARPADRLGGRVHWLLAGIAWFGIGWIDGLIDALGTLAALVLAWLLFPGGARGHDRTMGRCDLGVGRAPLLSGAAAAARPRGARRHGLGRCAWPGSRWC